MRLLLFIVGWCLLLLLCWPLAVLVLLAFPFVWLLSLPFRLAFHVVEGAVALLRAIFLLPARLLGVSKTTRPA